MTPLISALNKDVPNRNNGENKQLMAYFRTLSCFKKLSFVKYDNDMMKIINSSTLACVPKKTVLFRKEERGRCFYICLSGTSQLFLANQKIEKLRSDRKNLLEEFQELKAEAEEIRGNLKVDPITTQFKLNSVQKNSNIMKEEIEKLEFELTQTDDMEPIVQFNSGSTFGEIALMKSKGRTGTVLCQTGCLFAIIGGESYEKLIRKESLQEQSNSIIFFKQIPYVNEWTISDVMKILNYRKEKWVEKLG